MRDKPIGIFDSGLGGLTVQKEISKLLPAEETIYLGDTARVPYGTKSSETVTGYALEIARFLSALGIKMLVVACNTASAYSVGALASLLDIPVVGVIRPGANMAAQATKSRAVAVIGTEGTVRSRAYEKALKEIDSEINVYMKACPLFVPLAEEGFVNNNIAQLTAQEYLGYFDSLPIDTLVLGCTHYPLLKGVISKALGPGVTLIDSAEATARKVKSVLDDMGILREASSKGAVAGHSFFVTDSPERFLKIGRRFLSDKLLSVELVSLCGAASGR